MNAITVGRLCQRRRAILPPMKVVSTARQANGIAIQLIRGPVRGSPGRFPRSSWCPVILKPVRRSTAGAEDSTRQPGTAATAPQRSHRTCSRAGPLARRASPVSKVDENGSLVLELQQGTEDGREVSGHTAIGQGRSQLRSSSCGRPPRQAAPSGQGGCGWAAHGRIDTYNNLRILRTMSGSGGA